MSTALFLALHLVTAQAEIEVETRHTVVELDGKAYLHVPKGARLRAKATRSFAGERLSVDVVRVGKKGSAPAGTATLRVQVGNQRRVVRARPPLEATRRVPGDRVASYPVRHRFRLPAGATSVVVDVQQGDEGVLLLLEGQRRRKARAPALVPLAPVAKKPAKKARPPAKISKARGDPDGAPKKVAARSTQPATTESQATEPAATETSATGPAATETPATGPAATETPTKEPAATEVATKEPAATEVATKEPAATETATTEPAATETPLEPATETPTTETPTTEPTTTEPTTTEPTATAVAPEPPAAASGEPLPVGAPPPPPPSDGDAPALVADTSSPLPVRLSAQVAAGGALQLAGGLSPALLSGGVRAVVGAREGWLSRYAFGLALDFEQQQAAAASLPVRWTATGTRVRVEAEARVLAERLGPVDVDATVLGGVGFVAGSHDVVAGGHRQTALLLGPTARVALVGGLGLGPGAVTVTLPLDASVDTAGETSGFAPIAAGLYVGYRLDL